MATLTVDTMSKSLDGDTTVTVGAVVSADITDNTLTSADIKDAEIVNADVSASAAIAYAKLAALPSAQVLVGSAANVATAVAMSGDVAISNTGATTIQPAAVSYAKIQDVSATNRLLGRSTAGAGDVEEITVGGDITQSGSTFTIGAGAVTNAKVADSAGVGALGIRKSATVLYDFAVDGGLQGTITLAGSPTIPDNAVVWVESYDVLTTCTSGGADAATIALQLPTDGPLTTAIAISNGTNPWDAGVYSRIAGGLATPLTVKTTAARVPSLLVAGGNNLTAGKIVFQLAYWVSQ